MDITQADVTIVVGIGGLMLAVGSYYVARLEKRFNVGRDIGADKTTLGHVSDSVKRIEEQLGEEIPHLYHHDTQIGILVSQVSNLTQTVGEIAALVKDTQKYARWAIAMRRWEKRGGKGPEPPVPFDDEAGP